MSFIIWNLFAHLQQRDLIFFFLELPFFVEICAGVVLIIYSKWKLLFPMVTTVGSYVEFDY